MQDVTLQLTEVIFQISRLMKEGCVMDKTSDRLSHLQFHTLMFIDHHKDVTMGEIADYFHIEMPSATSLVSKLCDLSLVERHSSDQDRRLVLLSLTKSGTVVLDRVKHHHQQQLKQRLSLFSMEEQQQLLALLETFKQRMLS